MSFYYHASSVECMNYYPLNKASCFECKLPHELDGSLYDVSLLNINFNNNRCLLQNIYDRTLRLNFNGETHDALIPCQKFSSIEEFVTCLSEIFADYTDSISIRYTEDSKVLIKTINSELKISQKVGMILGMTDTTFVDTVKYGKLTPSLDNINHVVYVCIDETVTQLAGNGYIPFIQVLHPSNAATNINQSVQPNIYIPLKSHRINAIKIFLCDNVGKDIDIAGETQVLLHFKLKNG